MGRTTRDLVDELNQEARDAMYCVLVVGFETTTLYVSASDRDQLKKLNDMVREGGEPVGIIRLSKEGPALEIACRPLVEYQSEDWVRGYLMELMNEVRQQALASGTFG